jgi:nitrile hydratase
MSTDEHDRHDHDHHTDHHHHHGDHGHDHSELSESEIRVRTLESLLVEKGYVVPETIDAIIESYESKIGPKNGAHVVAKAWTDPAFMEWLRRDATAAIASLGYSGRQAEHIVVVENTPGEHNLVVCTLCSCYPWAVLGLPPAWYKKPAYRSKAVIDPRAVLSEFGTTVKPDTKIRVWDSTAEIRYLVLPMRPENTEDWTQEMLARLVTRDSMIGVSDALRPSEVVA